MSAQWKRIQSYNVLNSEGETELYHLERSEENGSFRIINDFGNNCIDFDTMSGYEMIKRVKESFENEIEQEINQHQSSYDCQSDDYHW